MNASAALRKRDHSLRVDWNFLFWTAFVDFCWFGRAKQSKYETERGSHEQNVRLNERNDTKWQVFLIIRQQGGPLTLQWKLLHQAVRSLVAVLRPYISAIMYSCQLPQNVLQGCCGCWLLSLNNKGCVLTSATLRKTSQGLTRPVTVQLPARSSSDCLLCM